MEIVVTGGDIKETEQQAYVDYLENKYTRKLQRLEIELDGDYANLNYAFQPVQFDRIRRITGYLTGNLNTWNNAKRAEESERKKHSLTSELKGV